MKPSPRTFVVCLIAIVCLSVGLLELWIGFEEFTKFQDALLHRVMVACCSVLLYSLLFAGIWRYNQLAATSASALVFLRIQVGILTLFVFLGVPGFFMFLERVLPGFEKEPRAIILVVALLIVSGVGARMYRRNFKKWRHASDTPTSKIRSAAQGYVELKGRIALVEGQPPLIAPLSGIACVWWEYEIRRGRDIIETKRSTADSFYLDDGTGQCKINLEGAKIIEHSMREWHGKTRYPQPGDRHTDEGSYEYVESLLFPGRRLYALGEFKSRHGQHLLEKPKDGRPFILSGKNETRLIADARSYVIWGALLFIVGVVGSALLIVFS